MTNKEAVNWIINLSADIGKSEHSELWHYEQALYEIREILESAQQWIPLKEKLPNDEQRVLLSSRGGVELVTWDEDSKRLYCDCRSLVVAWMPVPEPYEEADG